MIVITSNGSKYVVTNEQATLAREAQANGGVLYLRDKNIQIKGTAIMEVRPSDEDDLSDGKWQCRFGHIHPKEDTWCGIGDLSKKVALMDKNPKTPEQEQVEHQRQREQMAKVRENLGKKLRWPKRG